MNLAVNARDAMPTGGRLTIETANVELDESYTPSHVDVRPGSYVMLAVSDTGSAWTQETKRAHCSSRSSPPRSRARAPASGWPRSTASSSKAAATSGSTASSAQGTTFKVYLPRADGPIAVRRRPPPRRRLRRRRRETVLRRRRRGRRAAPDAQILEPAGLHGARGAEPRRGRGAVRAPQRHASTCSSPMWSCPGSSGPQMFERLVQRRRSQGALYVSGYTDDTIVHQGILNPGIALLHKPFTADALKRRVRDVLDQVLRSSRKRSNGPLEPLEPLFVDDRSMSGGVEMPSAASSYPRLWRDCFPSRSSFWSRSFDARIRSCSASVSELGSGTTVRSSSSSFESAI